jgi:hypothetical protein
MARCEPKPESSVQRIKPLKDKRIYAKKYGIFVDTLNAFSQSTVVFPVW